MISQTLEYALRAAVYLADRAPEAANTAQIADTTRVPAAYLSKVLQSMAHAGVVRSQRGAGGGFSLVKAPEEISILEIVDAVDPVQRIRTCPLGLASHGVRLCPLHKRLDDTMAQVEDAFRQTTLAEILAEPTQSVPLCDFPKPPRKKAKAKRG